MTRATITLLLLALALAPGVSAKTRGDPFEGAKLYVDPDSNAARQADEWRATRPLDAMAMQRIASRPKADWFGDWNEDIRRDVGGRVAEIAAAGALPVLVAYNIPGRDCGGHSAGGARSARAYLAWMRAFAAGIGDRRAAVVLEPDALAGIDCLAARAQRARLGLLRRAVRVLESRSAASVYIDAGHSGWNPVGVTVRRLRNAGIRRARGFALNVSNFRLTESELDYGHRIGATLDDKNFVIDTSRNGLGPAPDGTWCNPPDRALGPPATAATADPLADAYLWIKPPGESDGACNGGPGAGVWWPEYALGLAQRASGDQ